MLPNRLPRGSVLAAVLLATVACGESSTPSTTGGVDARQAPPGRGGTIVLGLSSDLDHLNPYLSARAANRDVAYHVYESLAEEQADFGQGPPTFRPALASSWESSADGRELTFHLRPEAVWSDGTPVTAEDVRFTWQASVHPDVAWLASEIKQWITDVRVDNPHTATFVFSRVYPYQMMDANDGVILPKHVWSRVPFDQWRTSGLDRDPVCSGPFRVARWVRNQSIELVRNEHYWDSDRPQVERVVYRILPDAAAGLEQLLAGEIDYWDRLKPADLRRVEADADVDVHRYADRFYGFIMWNCARPPFDSAAVRRALTLAIDRQRIVDDLLHGAGELASGPVPPLYRAHDASLAAHPHDAREARRLLLDAGWTDSDDDGWLDRDGRPFRFDLEVTADATVRRDMALLIQEDLKALGVDARVTPLERNTFNERHAEHRFDAYIGGWRLPTKTDLGVMFRSTAADSGVNYGRYSSPELDTLLDELDTVQAYEEALPLFRQALGILHEDAPYTFLYWQDRLVGIGARIEDAAPNAQSSLFNLDEWRLSSPDGGL